MAETNKGFDERGALIGEFEGSSDPIENAARARSFIGEKLGRRERNVGLACMNEAVAFHRAALIIRDRQPFEPPMVFPYVVNLSFAVELFLKTLTATESTSLRGHNLNRLLDEVPTDRIQLIEKHCSSVKVEDCDLSHRDHRSR